MSDEADLGSALGGLSRMLTADQTLESTLEQIAEFAVEAIPNADGAGLTLLNEEGAATVVASADFARTIDELQHSLREGPCITAVQTTSPVVSGSLGGDPQWTRFGPRVGRMGVHSVLSIPLMLDGRAIGALNVYSHSKHAFGEEAARLGERFAGPAAVSAHNARVLTETQLIVDNLTAALTNRATIDQAIGIIMSRTGCGPSEAFDRLRSLSQSQKVKVSELATSLVNEAVSRARVRHGADESRPGGFSG